MKKITDLDEWQKEKPQRDIEATIANMCKVGQMQIETLGLMVEAFQAGYLAHADLVSDLLNDKFAQRFYNPFNFFNLSLFTPFYYKTSTDSSNNKRKQTNILKDRRGLTVITGDRPYNMPAIKSKANLYIFKD